MKECPYCAELIQDKAIKCRYCGEWLEQPPHNTSPNSNNLSEPIIQLNPSLVARVSKVSLEEMPFLIKAIEKYFLPTQLSTIDKNPEERLAVLANLLNEEHPKALNAVLEIYGL